MEPAFVAGIVTDLFVPSSVMLAELEFQMVGVAIVEYTLDQKAQLLLSSWCI